MKRKPILAQELMAKLAESPAYLRRQRQWEADQAAAAAQYAEATRPIIEDLRAAGFDMDQRQVVIAGQKIRGLDYFLNTNDPFPEAIPVLVRHVGRDYAPRVKEALVRALTVKEARGLAFDALACEFRRSPSNPQRIGTLKWTCANALTVVATDADVPALIELLLDPSQGWERHMLVRALARFVRKHPEAKAAIERVANDPGILGEWAHKELAKLQRAEERKKLRT